jgi:putative ABC transport system ATP-binding protein
MISLEDVSVRFGDRAASEILALQSVSLRFNPGAFYALIGPSGSGKTTLLHVVAGILVPSAGNVRVGDLPLNGMREGKRDAWRRQNCGLIFQDFRLIDELSPVSNVLVPSWFTTMRTSPKMRERAEALLAHFNVPFRSGPVAALSRGQQQRVAMARALLLEPSIVLADEPTASVDKANAELIIQEMHRLARSGKTVICASHDERVAHHADKVLHIEDGRFVDEASESERSTGTEVR